MIFKMVNKESDRLEIILYNSQEAKKWREDNNVISVEPISWWKPQEAVPPILSQEKQGNGSTRKRRRSDSLEEVDVEIREKSFSLLELYKSSNIKEIVTWPDVDPQQLHMNLQGWTIKTRRLPHRVDKVYQHPNSKRTLRSLREVKKFILDNSCIRKNVGQGGSTTNVEHMDENSIGMSMPKRLDSQGSRMPSLYSQSNLYTKVFQKFSNYIDQQTSQRGTLTCWTQDSTSAPKATVFESKNLLQPDLKQHLHDHQFTTTLQESSRMNGHDQSLTSAGVRRPSPSDVYGASASSIVNYPSTTDEIKMIVQSQVEAQVAEKLYEYEKNQREMLERIKSMQSLIMLRGELLPPSQLP